NTVQAARNEEAYQKALAEARKLLAGEAQGADGRYTQLSAEKRRQVEAQLDQALKVRPNDATAAKLRASMGEPAALALPLADGVKMDFVLVPAGSFSMGAEDGDKTEKPVHKVALTRPYYVAKFPVTVLQFAVFHAEKGYKTEAENNLGRDGGDKGYSAGDTTAWNSPGYPRQDQAPVTLITWKEANDFAEWLSAKSGRTVRLATEAEWEHAARAGTQKRFGSGDGEADLEAVGWCSSNSRKKAQPVGQKAANAFGLHDMLGNVNEWCGDNFDSEYYGASPAQDPKGPEKQGNKVYRGGSWKDKPEACRVSARGSASRVTYRNDLGFRLVVEAK
ncbi:MAG: SUMF1/EgtB/PvdO family nonheme iron enzyme, partial [Planctomycetota bacterium]|nr:SUMF1/EgtB/PvdO family nonheme iron enzyme [Planctomycetota bacterium]